MFSEKELEKQSSTVKKTLLIVFIPIFGLISLIFLYRSNSLNYIESKYFKSRNKEFKGRIVNKYKEDDNLRTPRYLILDTNHQEFVYQELYQKISIGDSIIKRKGSDSIIYKLKNGSIIIKDYNHHLREKYYELLKKEN